MSAADLAAVREALPHERDGRIVYTQTLSDVHKGRVALARLAARLQEAEDGWQYEKERRQDAQNRLQEAERERDEVRAMNRRLFSEVKSVSRAEAREAALREALTDIDDYLRTCEPFVGPRHSTKAEVIVRRVRQRIAALAAEVGEAG